MRDIGRKATEGCEFWQRNRSIRRAYNEAARAARTEIEFMRGVGKSKRDIAMWAHQFRHEQRMKARELMHRNGDTQSVKDLEARDLEEYHNKDGPKFEQSMARARGKLMDKLGRAPTEDEVLDRVTESSTETNWVKNLQFLAF